MAGPPSTLDIPLHPHLGLLAQRGGKLLLRPDPAAHSARCLQVHRRPSGDYRPLPRRAQFQPKALPSDQTRCIDRERNYLGNLMALFVAWPRFLPERRGLWTFHRGTSARCPSRRPAPPYMHQGSPRRGDGPNPMRERVSSAMARSRSVTKRASTVEPYAREHLPKPAARRLEVLTVGFEAAFKNFSNARSCRQSCRRATCIRQY